MACENCQRLGFGCSLSKDGDSRKPELRRVSKACVRCKDHKIRCTGGSPCNSCAKKKVACEYPGPGYSASSAVPEEATAAVVGSPGPGSVSSPEPTALAGSKRRWDAMRQGGEAPSHSSKASEREPPPRISKGELIDLFFEHVYPLPSYAFLHPATTRKRFADSSLDLSLINAIAAVSSLRSPGVERDIDQETAWVQEAEGLFWQYLDSPSIVRLQATLLVILYRAETGQLRRAFMLAALAGRAAAAMRLNHERPGSQAVALEVRRRLMWSLKLVERYFSVGLPEFELCPVENLYIQLPCYEYDFGSEGDGWAQADDRGAYHLCVKLEMLRRDVMKLTRSLALCEQPFPQLPKLMQDFQHHLQRIGTQLPGGPDLSPTEVGELLGNRWLPRHLLMRLSWHQCHCDLYRLTLRNFRDSAPKVVVESLPQAFLDEAETSCIHHAQSTVQWLMSLSTMEPRLLEFDTAICAYTASRLLLFTARFGLSPNRPSEDFALNRAELCLSTVQKFFPTSVLVRPIVEELKRLISVFVAAEAPSRFSSPKPAANEKGKDPTAGLSEEARIRQRLAIHSLLRQAGFSDEEDETDDDPSPVARKDDRGGHGEGGSAPPVAPSTAQQTNNIPMANMDHGTIHSEQTTPDMQEGDAWPHKFFMMGDLWQDEDESSASVAPQGAVLTQRSFTFPWLQREESDLLPMKYSVA